MENRTFISWQNVEYVKKLYLGCEGQLCQGQKQGGT